MWGQGIKMDWNCNFVSLIHHSFRLQLVFAFSVNIYNFWNFFVWRRISVLPEMSIRSLLLIKSDLKWCIHLSWLLFLRINVDLAIFQPYLDLEAGDNQSLKIQVARPGIEPRSSCSASQELNHSATAAPIHLSRSLYFSTTWWVSLLVDKWVPREHVAKSYGLLRLIRSVLRASKFSV